MIRITYKLKNDWRTFSKNFLDHTKAEDFVRDIKRSRDKTLVHIIDRDNLLDRNRFYH